MVSEKGISIKYDRLAHDFVGITPDVKQKLRAAFKSVDVDKELVKMKLWLESKGVKRKGNLRFITSWLTTATNGFQTYQRSPGLQFDIEFPQTKLLDNYLQDLWKNREHLLELNSKTR